MLLHQFLRVHRCCYGLIKNLLSPPIELTQESPVCCGINFIIMTDKEPFHLITKQMKNMDVSRTMDKLRS